MAMVVFKSFPSDLICGLAAESLSSAYSPLITIDFNPVGIFMIPPWLHFK